MSLKEDFDAAVLSFLKTKKCDAVKVEYMYDNIIDGCETCGPSYSVDIYYINSKDKRKCYVYNGSLSDLLERILAQ